MEYQYKCRITAWDFFRLTMRQTYRSMAGMCNLVFTVAMILLTAKFWSQSGEVLQVLMLIGCLLFPVIQPAAIYAKARRQAAAVHAPTSCSSPARCRCGASWRANIWPSALCSRCPVWPTAS